MISTRIECKLTARVNANALCDIQITVNEGDIMTFVLLFKLYLIIESRAAISLMRISHKHENAMNCQLAKLRG